MSLTVKVDKNVLVPAAVRLHYSLNRNPPDLITINGSGGGVSSRQAQAANVAAYTFNLPGTLLPEGTKLDYAFEVVGTFSTSACLTKTGAIWPYKHGFHAVASDHGVQSRAVNEATNDALLSAIDQPQFVTKHDPTTICTGFFVSPNPCELYPARLSEPPDDGTTGTVPLRPGKVVTPPGTAEGQEGVLGMEGKPTKTCILFDPANGWGWKKERERESASITSDANATYFFHAPSKSVTAEATARASSLGGNAESSLEVYAFWRYPFAAVPGFTDVERITLVNWRATGKSSDAGGAVATPFATGSYTTIAKAQVDGWKELTTSSSSSEEYQLEQWTAAGVQHSNLPVNKTDVLEDSGERDTVWGSVTFLPGDQYSFGLRVKTTATVVTGLAGAGWAWSDYYDPDIPQLWPDGNGGGPAWRLRVPRIKLEIIPPSSPNLFFDSAECDAT